MHRVFEAHRRSLPVGLAPLARPGRKRSDELALLDQAVLQGKQPKQEVMVSSRGELRWISIVGRRLLAQRHWFRTWIVSRMGTPEDSSLLIAVAIPRSVRL